MQIKPQTFQPTSPPAQRRGLFGIRLQLPGGLEVTAAQLLLAAAILLFAFATPGDFTYKLEALGFGVCHQISTHSYFEGSHQLPLCARCSGIYLGALASVGLLAIFRRRAVRWPAGHILAILGVFFLAMALDGVNSTLQGVGAGFWDSTNLVRILTGSLAGVAVAFAFYPMFNLSVWHRDAIRRERVLDSPYMLFGYMLVVGLLVALVLSGGDWLYYPLAIMSIAGMLMLLTMANTIIVLIATRHEAQAVTLSQVLTPVMAGFLLCLIEVSVIAWGRASLAPYLANNLGMPLVPGQLP